MKKDATYRYYHSDWVEAQVNSFVISTGGVLPRKLKAFWNGFAAGMPEEGIFRTAFYPGIQTRFAVKHLLMVSLLPFDLRTGMNISKIGWWLRFGNVDPVWISAAVPESIAYLLKDTSQFENFGTGLSG